jgi:hypothetical protein
MSPDEEFYRRRRRYAILMGTRAICIVAAVLTYRVSLVLALGLVAGGAILPWCAVIIANGRLLDRRRRPRAGLPALPRARALPPGREDARPRHADDGRPAGRQIVVLQPICFAQSH